jgi:hypothetical protein
MLFCWVICICEGRLNICGVFLLEKYERNQLEASASCASLCIVICVLSLYDKELQ